ncbi:MAG: hypothetical protein JWN75_360 [Candidatus Saccharibacteria bacterium]|nr:hypothetical protein [Candidatus Saccharibacteria bacterium]
MLLVTSLLRWWYGDGWRQRAQQIANRLDGTIDYFSVGLLIKSLFAPFRQISAGKVDGPIGLQMRAMIDRLFSRLVGAFVRLLLLVIGGIVIGLQVIVGFILLLGWAAVPLLPIIGLALTLTGWAF